MIELGNLEKVSLRQVWKHEALDFTPWLATEVNLKRLADVLGTELVLERQEKEVGSFSADILCRDTANDCWVLIENQLERTDHTHLGQLLTYAAGLDAVTIVWIAERFTNEHRAALDWLNDNTSEDINFFGLEIELWQIGNSEIAPKFQIISQPNDWTKKLSSARQGASQSPAKQLLLNYWEAFTQYLSEQNSPVRLQKAQPQNWINVSVGKTGFHVVAVANTQGKIRVELSISNNNSKDYFDQLFLDKNNIEAEIGHPLSWERMTDTKMCRIAIYKEDSRSNISNQSDWDYQHSWLKEYVEKFCAAFARRIKNLSVITNP